MLDCLLIWTEWPHLDATDWNNNNNNTANSGAVGGCNICTWTKTHSFDHPPTHKRLNNNPIAFILLMRVGETLMHPIQCQSFCLLFTTEDEDTMYDSTERMTVHQPTIAYTVSLARTRQFDEEPNYSHNKNNDYHITTQFPSLIIRQIKIPSHPHKTLIHCQLTTVQQMMASESE